MTQQRLKRTLQDIASAASMKDGTDVVDRVLVSDSDTASMATVADDARCMEVVQTVWEEMLRVSSIDIDDDFFALGGDSILLVQALSQISSILKVQISLADILEVQSLTVREITKSIRQH